MTRLDESYQPPNNARQSFFDMYALYSIWFKVDGYREYGYTEGGVFTNELFVKRIGDALFTSATHQAETLIRGIMAAIVDEFENIYDEHLIEPEQVRAWGYNHPHLYRLVLAYAPPDSYFAQHPEQYQIEGEPVSTGKRFWQLFTIPQAAEVFDAPFWAECADLYGGDTWSTITRRFGSLLEAYKGKSLKDLVFELDQTYDLEHNTGSILSKFKPAQRIKKADLDLRASISSLKEFVPLVSPFVRQAINYVDRPAFGVVECRKWAALDQHHQLNECNAADFLSLLDK